MKNIKDNRMRKVNYSLQNKLKYRKYILKILKMIKKHVYKILYLYIIL